MSELKKYPVVAAVFTIDKTYEDEHPVFALPVVLTSCGLQIRHQGGSPQTKDDGVTPRRTFRIGSDETLHTVIPIQGVSLIQTAEATDEEESKWEFLVERDQ